MKNRLDRLNESKARKSAKEPIILVAALVGVIVLFYVEGKGTRKVVETTKLRKDSSPAISFTATTDAAEDWRKPPATTASADTVENSVSGVGASTTDAVEDWRKPPVGDHEDIEDSYHSFDHRPPGNDPRDAVLENYVIHPCPNNGLARMISGQDSRYHELESPLNADYKERNPKFICDIEALTINNPNQPCVVYSFGSFDEISFEIGVNQATDNKCEIHIFDPVKRPPEDVALKNHVHSHAMGLVGVDDSIPGALATSKSEFKTLSTIMAQLGHSHINILKIDVEGAEETFMTNLKDTGVLAKVDFLSMELHSVAFMKPALDVYLEAGFGIVYARGEDRCPWCTEVSLARV